MALTTQTEAPINQEEDMKAVEAELRQAEVLLLELAGVLRQSDPKQAASVYEQIKKDYSNTTVADEADRGLGTITPKS